MHNLEQLSDIAQAYFDEFVVNGTDDELFASGYLRGHVDLVIGHALVKGEEVNLDAVVERVSHSINNAIKSGELEQADVITVNNVLNSLIIKWQGQ